MSTEGSVGTMALRLLEALGGTCKTDDVMGGHVKDGEVMSSSGCTDTTQGKSVESKDSTTVEKSLQKTGEEAEAATLKREITLLKEAIVKEQALRTKAEQAAEGLLKENKRLTTTMAEVQLNAHMHCTDFRPPNVWKEEQSCTGMRGGRYLCKATNLKGIF